MFAVLKTGGKQYRVQAGDVLRVEKLAAASGDKVQFNEILMVGATVGTPLIDGAGVQAEVIDQIKGEKTINFVKRRRKHGSKRTKGHRQQLTLLRVTDILEKGAEKSGVMAAVGGAGHVVSDGRYAKNRSEQAEMTKRVKTGGAEEKVAETKAAPKKAEAKKTEPKKAAPKKSKAEEGGDDLKQLSGVGPALEKKLNEAGVTTIAQIADWSADDIAAMDEKLSFKGRIEREGWVDQAKAIVAEKE